MLINGIELSSLGAELYDRVLYSNDIQTSQDWLDGDIQPTFIRQQDKFKNIKLEFLVISPDEEDAFRRISTLTALLKRATIKFDDLNFFFDVNITDVIEPRRLKNGNFIVGYNLTSGYAKGVREVYTTNANATNSFKLTVAYYMDGTQLISNETVTIRASSFDSDTVTLADIGINANKHQPQYYNPGVATNMGSMDLTYENLQALQILIINYSPVSYNVTVNYYLDDNNGGYNEIIERTISFTKPQLDNIQTIGQLVGLNNYRPEGYRGSVQFDAALNVENLLAFSPISVFYTKIAEDRSKNILIAYKQENDNGEYETFDSILVNVVESSLYDGSVLKDIINIEGHRPNATYYNSGYIDNHEANELITFDTLEAAYNVIYTKATNTVYVEYYAGTYPNWHRLTTAVLQTKYKTSYETEFDVVKDLNIDLNKYHTAPYNDGVLYNVDNFTTYADVLNAGVLQVYYTAIDYPITVNYYTNGLSSEPISETVNINALMFFGNPLLSDIIPIAAHRPEGYQFDEFFSYDGEVTLEALTQASPIMVVYSEIQAARTKNIIIRYKQELSSAYSTINTSLITVSEADIVGGTRLRDIISLNAYKPEYYEDGIIDGASSTAIIQYEEIASEYNVLYVAASYATPVRYYIDEVNDNNWIGSSTIAYRVIDFAVGTTLYDFGLSLNMYKPVYTSDGELLYTGPVNFTALLEAESINVLYTTVEEPGDDDDIDYPHRFLFLQHNDLGSFEYLHPEWTLNHAFINTGISADDMSKLTIVMECGRADPNVPLYDVNAKYAYLFGSTGPFGSFFMRYNNQTTYGVDLTGINTYEAKAGNTSNLLTLTEDAAVGFSENTGIYASAQEGYSRAIFTYSHLLATESAQMPYPIYLFANNLNGSYANGIAGIGIYGCRIYYNDQLVRDFVPVQFYDKIGDQVAPSNCLYDKITKTFFEDGTGLNSFNIRDDDRYIDDNLQHKIGQCYVNYYKGEEFIKTVAVHFRGDEFDEGEFDLYERFYVDANQPQYCKAGEIKDITSINVSFNGLNNKVFTVVYEPISAVITANYYQEVDGVEHLIATDEIALEEKDFYQVPSFGDLVRLNKYKPDGYETDFVYTGSKVSLQRVMEGSPYKIVYKPIEGDLEIYTTRVVFQKKVFGVRQYEILGEKTLTFDQSNFRDGEYIDFYINKNELKPEKFYLDGITYQWYEMDERLTTPADLKDQYIISYMPETQYLDVDYYTDVVDEANLIASTSWGLAIDELEPGYTYSIVDIIPNDYINKYKPVRCNGGIIQGANVEHTFETLMELGHIDIVYESLYEPDDPTQAYYEQKVIYFGQFLEDLPLTKSDGLWKNTDGRAGGMIPYIDLGYRPKELGRLRMEVKAVAQAHGFVTDGVADGGWQDTTYVDWLGYRVPKDTNSLGNVKKSEVDVPEEDLGNFYSYNVPVQDRGHFSFSTRVPIASGWVYTAEGPQFVDNQVYYTANVGTGMVSGSPKWIYYGTDAEYRKGASKVLDENWEEVVCYSQYGQYEKRPILEDWIINTERYGNPNITPLANPVTTVLDAYNNYWTSYTAEDSNNAPYKLFEDVDTDIFEARLQPKGSITAFRTRNPLTGNVNIMAHYISTRKGHNGFPMALQGGNPYTGGYREIEYEVWVQVDTDEKGNPIYQSKKQYKNVEYADFDVPVHPQLQACAIWSIKIWDRDRLVRDLIPVAKGDKIYDYIMPENGMFDLVTEIFFGNSNEGGTYTVTTYFGMQKSDETSNGPTMALTTHTTEIKPEEVFPFKVILDPGVYGKITMNYYDYDYTFLGNQFVTVPTWFSYNNTTFAETVGFNDMKPSEFHLDGFLDIDDPDNPLDGDPELKEIYEMGSANVMYKLRTFTKTVVYYQDNYRVGSKDLFFSVKEIEEANSLADLGIDIDLYWNEDFAHGEVIFDETILQQDDIQAFIDAPSPIVVYKKLTKEEAPNLLYVEYYRGGAYDESLITPDPDNENYFDCNLDGVVLNPNGAIKYYNHYHSALYEDEKFDYFIPYQVKVINKYIGIHRGPARKFPTLATIIELPVLTIIEERNGWGRLKEYPVGWIMLSATEPVTGPGQNPEYDVPDAETATIPFATEVHISKLTVDRLWCYIPEVESWVKAEDISYNQSGKLYNALDIDVIHLDELDFSSVTTLYDMGISPNKRMLYFHDREDYEYTGEYTYEAFSELHELEFMYPETIYNYTCIYYKDNVGTWSKSGPVTKTGTAMVQGPGSTVEVYKEPYFSSELYTNGAVVGATVTLLGPRVTINGIDWYPIEFKRNQMYQGYTLASNLIDIVEPEAEIESGTNELGRASFSCSISDWNPDWDVFIATSWQVDENGKDINPTLYRDAELTLTWQYFGFDKNLFRPEGYFEGIYLWNPRSWDHGDISFNFQELIRTGSQIVVYPSVPLNMYKIANATDEVELAIRDSNGRQPQFTVNLQKYPEGAALNNFYDIDVVFDPSTTSSYRLAAAYRYIPDYNYNAVTTYNGGQYDKTIGANVSLTALYAEGRHTVPSGYHTATYSKDFVHRLSVKSNLKYKEPGDYFSINYSNHRPETTFVFGYGNSRTGLKEKYYLEDGTQIFNNTNIRGHYGLSTFDELYEEYGGRKPDTSYGTTTYLTGPYSATIQPITVPANKNASAMSVTFYQNFLARHYWVPVPKGYRYTYNGNDLQIPQDGWFDLMTGGFKPSPNGVIYLRHQIVGVDEKYDYFKDWYYESTDIDYIVQINTAVPTFQQPDKYAIGVRTLTQGLVLPVSKVTADADNHVIGEWYYTTNQWFDSSKASIHAGAFDKTKLTKLQQTFCLVHPTTNETYYVYLNPAEVAVPGETSSASYGNSSTVLTAYYNYVDTNGNKYYFDGNMWVPEKYTSFNIIEHNKNYAVIPDNLTFYSQPIANEAYAVGNYHYGERITVLHVCAQNQGWGFTGLGWIQVNDNTVSEVV